MRKFHQHKLILLNQHVFLKLKLKLLEATVFAITMFGLALLPLAQRYLHKLDVVQRQMLRSCWVRIPAETSEITMGRMNQRIGHAASLHALPTWRNQCFVKQYGLATTIASNQVSWAWAATAIAWMLLSDWVHNFPSAPSRNRGGRGSGTRFV